MFILLYLGASVEVPNILIHSTYLTFIFIGFFSLGKDAVALMILCADISFRTTGVGTGIQLYFLFPPSVLGGTLLIGFL